MHSLLPSSTLLAFCLAGLLAAATGAEAQTAGRQPAQQHETPPKELVHSDVSTRDIAIESNFNGIEIVVFGAVDFADENAEENPYDVIVVVKGPDQDLIARRKERIAGVWLTGASRVFHDVPGFYAVLSTRPLRAIATEEELAKLNIGFSALDLGPDDNTSVDDDLFRQSVIRIQEDKELYKSIDDGVRFVGRSLFRGTVDLPVNVPVGLYTTEVYLFQGGKLLSKDEGSLHVQKVGFERGVYTLALDRKSVV